MTRPTDIMPGIIEEMQGKETAESLPYDGAKIKPLSLIIDHLAISWVGSAKHNEFCEDVEKAIAPYLRPRERESGEPFLHNRADGVDGHYCIARKSSNGDYYEYYEAGKWVSATSLIFYLGKATRIEDVSTEGGGDA